VHSKVSPGIGLSQSGWQQTTSLLLCAQTAGLAAGRAAYEAVARGYFWPRHKVLFQNPFPFFQDPFELIQTLEFHINSNIAPKFMKLVLLAS
jgi:hypothetical protein